MRLTIPEPPALGAHLDFSIQPQPDDTTCGPTCLHAVYRYFDDPLPLDRVIRETGQLTEGGTLAVMLACHALDRGYAARIYTYNLQVFDPTWFNDDAAEMPARLRAQRQVKSSKRLQAATDHYLRYLDRGGELRFEELTPALIRRYLKRGVPILTGLSATYLYRCARERDDGTNKLVYDDIRGVPTGHFVVLCGYDPAERTVVVADPLASNPMAADHLYHVEIDRLICAILLGVVTYDANLLILEPGRENNPGETAAT